MSEDLAIVGILRTHLIEWEKTLDHARGAFAAEDLAKDYRNMGSAPTKSRITMSVERDLVRLRSYLGETDEPT